MHRIEDAIDEYDEPKLYYGVIRGSFIRAKELLRTLGRTACKIGKSWAEKFQESGQWSTCMCNDIKKIIKLGKPVIPKL